MSKKKLPAPEEWVARRANPGEPYDVVDDDGYGIVVCKMVIPGTHAFTAAGANAEPEEEEDQ